MIGFNPNQEPPTQKVIVKEPGLIKSLVNEAQTRWVRADVYILACVLCFILGVFAGRS